MRQIVADLRESAEPKAASITCVFLMSLSLSIAPAIQAITRSPLEMAEPQFILAREKTLQGHTDAI